MKYRFFLIFFIFFSTSISRAEYNFESCHAFWKLTDKLRSGVLPLQEEWAALRQTEGYRRKNIPDNTWREFIDNVRLVFYPGNENKIVEQMPTNLPLRWLVRMATEETALKKFVDEVENLHIIDSAINYANELLEPKYRRCFKRPTMYFLLFDYDANGNSQGILMDLLVCYDMERYKPGMLSGHEMFHYALGSCRIKTRRFRNVPDHHQAVFIAVNAISEEGTADLIDKEHLLFSERSPYLLKDTFYALYASRSVECVKEINEALEKLSLQPAPPYTELAFWKTLMPVSAHVPGLFMVSVIRRNGLSKHLAGHVSNPFYFFYLYNKAARQDREKPPVFSSEAVRFLKSLEKRYLTH